MLNELIEKIAAQTGQPVESVAPIVGALLSHLGDVLPAPIAHQVAIFLGVHEETPGGAPAAEGTSDAGGLLGSLAGAFGSGSGGGQSNAGAATLVSVAESLLGGFLASRR